MLRLLTFSTLYPSAARRGHGIFVETRLRHLLASGAVTAKVVAPVPWFFSTHARWGDYAAMAATPVRETWNGIDVLHPRYLLPPRVGMTIAPLSLAAAGWRAMRQLQREGFEFDAVDAHYFYPDGVAAALLARALKKPLAITARGTDINLIPSYRLPRRMIQWAAAQADRSIGVCQALTDALRDLGAPRERLRVLRNGVDLERFAPVERTAARASLGWAAGPTLLSVGYLIERKGHALVIEALASLPGVRLVIVGDGPDRGALQALATRLGVADRVTLVGSVPQSALREYYSAADALVLASSREGWANVLLESMACGTPVVATRIWGTPEVVAVPEAGRLVDARTPTAIAAEARELLAAPPAPAAVRAYAEQFSWQATTEGQLRLFGEIVAAHAGAPSFAPGDAPRAGASR